MKATDILRTPCWAWAASERTKQRTALSGTVPRKTRVTLLPAAHILVPTSSYTSTRLCTRTIPCPFWCTLLLLPCMSSCCAITHTGLLFDFTSALRRLKQARPGISAIVFNNKGILVRQSQKIISKQAWLWLNWSARGKQLVVLPGTKNKRCWSCVPETQRTLKKNTVGFHVTSPLWIDRDKFKNRQSRPLWLYFNLKLSCKGFNS